MRPLSDKLVVMPIVSEKSRAGVVFPTSTFEDPNYGGVRLYRVLAVGPGRIGRDGVRREMPVSVGDRVLCHSYTASPQDLPGGQKLITLDQVIAFLPRGSSPTPD